MYYLQLFWDLAQLRVKMDLHGVDDLAVDMKEMRQRHD
jgi:hypothetical protein